MLFWMFIIIRIVCIILDIITSKLGRNDKYEFFYYNDTEIYTATMTIGILSAIVSCSMLIAILIQNQCAASQIVKYNETYKALIYKVENTNCRDEFGLLNKEIVDEVQEWNEDIAYSRELQDNFWVGVFYPNIYDNFELIDLNKFEK